MRKIHAASLSPAKSAGDATNAILSAGGYNFRRILAWLRILLRLFVIAFARLLISQSTLNPAY